MGRPCMTDQQSGRLAIRIASCGLVMIALGAPLMVHGRSQGFADSATLQGSVRDSRGHPVATATVYLHAKGGVETLTALTDAEGIYRFSVLPKGVYTLRAEVAGYSPATLGPFVLGRSEAKKVDFTLESRKKPEP